MNQVNLSVRKGFITKAILWWTRIWCLYQILKEEMEMVLHFIHLGVPSVGSNIWENVLPAQMNALGEGRRVII